MNRGPGHTESKQDIVTPIDLSFDNMIQCHLFWRHAIEFKA